LAQPASAGILDHINAQYLAAAKGWEASMMKYAQGLFWSLAIISFAWAGIQKLFKPDQIQGLFAMMVKQIMVLGFFSFLMMNGPYLAKAIIDSFKQAGAVASGSDALTPTYIVINGFDCAFRGFEKIGDLGLDEAIVLGLPMAFLAIGIVLCFTVIAIGFLITLIESYFVIYGGILLLGFGGSPWTRDIPKNYLVYALNVGVKLLVTYLVVGIGITASNEWPNMIHAAPDQGLIDTMLYILTASLIFAALAWKIPAIAAAMTQGGLNLGAADLVASAAAGGGAAVGAGAVMAAGVSATAGAARGAVQAMSAGIGLAKEEGASGSKALVSGLGHALGAVGGEAKTGAANALGVSGPSKYSSDARGRDVDNIGTRGANSLLDKTQSMKEQKAAMAPSALGESSGTPSSGAGSAAPAPAAGPVSPTATASAAQLPTPKGGHDANKDSGMGEALRGMRIPDLPSEGNGGGVSIKFDQPDE
jgi:P-type conjugative transfer protein TrbL